MPMRLMAVCLWIPAAFAQRPVEFTAKIGVPITESFESGSYDFQLPSEPVSVAQGASATRRYTVGGGIVARLPHGLSVEAEVLYQRLGYALYNSLDFYPHTWTTANSLEFPLLAVYRLPRWAGLTPQVSGGISGRVVAGESTTGAYCLALVCVDSGHTGPAAQPADPHLAARSHVGGTAGVGVAIRAGPVRIVPELRYTRWRADANASGSNFDLRSNANQVDFLLGFTF